MNGNTTQPLPPALAATEPQASGMSSHAPLSLHIDHLVLDGLPVGGGERGQLQAAVVAELENLLASGALNAELRGAGALQRLRLDDIRLHAGAGAEQIGRQIALALHKGIGS